MSSVTLKKLFSKLLSIRRFFVVILVAVIFSVTLTRLNAPKRLSTTLQSFHTTNRSEGYAELYFDDASHLPSSIASDSSVNFSFTIHNAKDHAQSYPYQVLVYNGTVTTIVDTGSISLTANANTSRNLNVQLDNSTTLRQQISILLPMQQQAISFWVPGTKL